MFKIDNVQNYDLGAILKKYRYTREYNSASGPTGPTGPIGQNGTNGSTGPIGPTGPSGGVDLNSTFVKLGYQSGQTNQGENTVAIGYSAGYANQGNKAIAIGYQAGYINQSSNSITINATNTTLNNTLANSCVIKPIRNSEGYANQRIHYNSTTGELTYGAEAVELEGIESDPWFVGKIWYALGTSITADGSYTSQLATLSGMNLYNYGASGQALGGSTNGGVIMTQLKSIPIAAEIITMETINDFRLNVTLGSMASPNNNATTYYGALKMAATWLLTNRPAARVFWITAYGDAYPTDYPNGITSNGQGKYYYEYNQAMMNVGAEYGIPVIKLGEESGINYYTCSYFTIDLIHMNTLGGKRYAQYVWARIKYLSWLDSRPTAPGVADTIGLESIEMVQSDFNTTATNTTQLTLTYTPSNATDKTVSWNSSNTNVATVSSSGLVTAVVPGTSTITATSNDGGFTTSVICTVNTVSLIGISLSLDTWLANVGDTVQLTVTYNPTNATNKTVTWSSSDEAVATVTSNGLIEAILFGDVVITATSQDGSYQDVCLVTVDTVPVSSVTVVPDTLELVVNDTEQLTVVVLPNNATNNTVTWSSSDTNVITVDSSGLVTGIATGSASVTATSNDNNSLIGICIIDVITVQQESWTLNSQTLFRGINVSGITNSGSNITSHSSPTSGTYGALIINSEGDNAIEITLNNPPAGGWFVLGSSSDTTKFLGIGDGSQNSLGYSGLFTNGSVSLTTIQSNVATLQWTAGYRYRIGRVGNLVKIIQITTGNVESVVLNQEIGTYTGNATTSNYSEINIGILCGSSPGNPYGLPLNCKSGTWVPPP